MVNIVQKIEKEIKSQNIQYIRFVWCDNAGLTRAKAVHARFISDFLEGSGVGIAAAQQALPVMYDAPVAGSGLTPVGEVHMMADWSTFTVLPYSPGHARVFTDIYDGNRPWSHCPRTFLRSVIAKPAALNLSFKAAFEDEFYLLSTTEGVVRPFDQSLFAQTYALDKVGLVLSEITDALMSQNIFPEMVYAESGNGQFEIPVHYGDLLRAADQQVAFKETVRGVVQKHENLIASFVPKIFKDKAGNGAHLHLSMWQNGQNITADPGKSQIISQSTESFVAGILYHLPALMSLTTPSTNSFKRIRPHSWSGAYACWGYGNREAAIRIPRPDLNKSITNIELKTVDPSCNPYLALGVVIIAGLDGIEKKMKLSKPINKDPGDLSQEERGRIGIASLPTNLGQSIELLKKDSVLLDALGPDLSRSFIAVRTAEWNSMKDLALEKEVEMLLERY